MSKLNIPIKNNLINRISILFTNYGPYHLARINSCQAYFKSDKWEVIGIEVSRDGVDYQWQTTLDSSQLKIYTILGYLKLNEVKLRHIIKKTCDLLSQLNPNIVVIAGYARLSMLSALIWCLWYKKPAILLSESKEDDELRVWWKELIKSFLIRKYSSALVGGQPHQSYLIKLGFPKNAIFTGYDVVDNDVFHPNQIKALSSPISKPYFLSINRFVSKKNLPLLISAYYCYRQQFRSNNVWDLVLCGEGELRSQLEELISQYQLGSHIHLPGFLQQQELLPYFAHAQCFIHASTTEQWGLVVNEAMAAGLPVLVSNRCGCFQDLVLEGINGFGFDPHNPEELVNLMLKMSSSEVNLEAMGAASLKHIQNFTPEHFARGLKQAIDYALAHH